MFFLEVACGPGELVKRAVQSGRYSCVIGTDNSDVALAFAKENLAASGIEARLVTPEVLAQNKSGVLLVKDNLVESKIPAGIADVTLFAFPELGTDYVLPADDLDVRRFSRWCGVPEVKRPLNEVITSYAEIYITVKADLAVARATRSGGKMCVVEYTSMRGVNEEREKRNIGENLASKGIQYVRHVFVENDGVWSDTVNAKSGAIQKDDELQGFRIVLGVRR